MTNTHISQSQKRHQESLSSLFDKKTDAQSRTVLFLKSSSDVGVMRNGGRNGARFAPRSLLSFFKKLTLSSGLEQYNFSEYEVSSQQDELNDFISAQELEGQELTRIVRSHPESFIIHIGGGHDHIFPLLRSFTEKKIVVLNIDAHADTRTDSSPHSGTPFRQFARQFDGSFYLFQIGLHPWANSQSTLTTLEKGTQEILWRDAVSDLEQRQGFFENIGKYIDENTRVVFSLDADALSGEQIPGVSAVNGKGLNVSELEQLWQEYLKLPMKHSPTLGIYELNPLYDSLSALSMRTISAFLYQCLRGK